MAKVYVIEVGGAPKPCWYCPPSDEDDTTKLHTTSDANMAARWMHFTPANVALRGLVRQHPSREFKLNVLEVF